MENTWWIKITRNNSASASGGKALSLEVKTNIAKKNKKFSKKMQRKQQICPSLDSSYQNRPNFYNVGGFWNIVILYLSSGY